MKRDKVKIIGGTFGYTEITINDEFQVKLTEDKERMIKENLEMIKELNVMKPEK